MGLEVLINSFFKDFSRIAFSVHITATVINFEKFEYYYEFGLFSVFLKGVRT